jgi:hypothetical protein
VLDDTQDPKHDNDDLGPQPRQRHHYKRYTILLVSGLAYLSSGDVWASGASVAGASTLSAPIGITIRSSA